jgi:hypothetical protein
MVERGERGGINIQDSNQLLVLIASNLLLARARATKINVHRSDNFPRYDRVAFLARLTFKTATR